MTTQSTKEQLSQNLQSLAKSIDRIAQLSREQQLALLDRLNAMDEEENA